jgi:hypothetical protein
MKIRWIVFTGVLGLAVATALAVSRDSGQTRRENPSTKSLQGEFYRGAEEKPVSGSTEVDARKGGSFVLKPVLQGDTVEHDFLIRNTFKKPLELKHVKSCCGVILTGHTPVIPPGETGKISVVIVTDKFGGETVNGRITADAADPLQPGLSIGVSLFVNKVADLSRFKIILKGSARETLKGESFIVPEKNHPFSVKGIKAKKGLHIQYDVKETLMGGRKGFLVTVKNTLKKPGIYRDTLFVMTDDPERPEIRVRVEGDISE